MFYFSFTQQTFLYILLQVINFKQRLFKDKTIYKQLFYLYFEKFFKKIQKGVVINANSCHNQPVSHSCTGSHI